MLFLIQQATRNILKDMKSVKCLSGLFDWQVILSRPLRKREHIQVSMVLFYVVSRLSGVIGIYTLSSACQIVNIEC